MSLRGPARVPLDFQMGFIMVNISLAPSLMVGFGIIFAVVSKSSFGVG